MPVFGYPLDIKRRALQQSIFTSHIDKKVNFECLTIDINQSTHCPFSPSYGEHRQDADSKH